MREGRKRQIRETGSLIGLPVVRIIRVRLGALRLGNLKSRQWRFLTTDEVLALQGGKVAKPQKEPVKKPNQPRQTQSKAGRKQKSK
jgi:23S rRNA pseudouridine2605 synthase